MFGFNNGKRNKANNEANKDTALDRAIKAKVIEIHETKVLLRERVINVIIANKAIKCYPDGADKIKAEKDAESMKNVLLASIGHYDCLMRDYNELLNKVGDNCIRNTTKGWHNNYCNSHKLVEIEVRNFYRER